MAPVAPSVPKMAPRDFQLKGRFSEPAIDAVFDQAKPSGEQRTVVCFNGQWKDLTGWKSHHPGGSEIIDLLHHQDGTSAFEALHSRHANVLLKAMPNANPTDIPAGKPAGTTSKKELAFREFRKQLKADGMFDRKPLWDAFYIGQCFALAIAGTWLANSHPWIAIVLCGLAQQQAGWVGHDYGHGRADQRAPHKYSWTWWANQFVGGGLVGLHPSWWSEKHNGLHHTFPNMDGVDLDIQNDPVLHIWFPTPEHDVWYRKYQHIYCWVVYAFLYASWRFQSLMYLKTDPNWITALCLLSSYVWLGSLPIGVAVGSVLFGGFCVAVVVTATHQSEELLDFDPAREYEYADLQFRTTRDAETYCFLDEWFWGGMQYQLEHHLFPTMPKYYYAELHKKLAVWAPANGFSFRSTPAKEILTMNWRTLREFAREPAAVDKTKKSS